ncbi:MAG: RdgB/HAM1 family non-canonical purine NTP pyrophosphatase [Arenicellales bacterium]|jgi:XTP/dITP diphosphohydrolase|nr:RdgB/HAM1 family non-canonical purine NTP pyrophosphatase [Arenicellales bacterium]|tara:strand:+ start:4167 stop:4763 length:597 start_codon:yes stop_codon:yes gene_type:complete
MKKIKEIVIGTNNDGKYREICGLLPKKTTKFSIKEFKILGPKETGESFEENSMIKASYFSKKTNLVCLADDSGLEIDLLNGAPGIYSARWASNKDNFDEAIEKIYKKMNKIKKDWKNNNTAKFICCLSIYWPNGKSYLSKATVKGKISPQKKGNNGFGYDPIFIPYGYKKTFGEMKTKLKMSIDHRYKAFLKIKKFFI